MIYVDVALANLGIGLARPLDHGRMPARQGGYGATVQDRGASTADEITYANGRRMFQEKEISNRAAWVCVYHVSDPRLPKKVDGLTNEQRARVLKDEEIHRKNGVYFVHFD